MQESKLDSRLIKMAGALVAVILVLIPFHALLSVWLSQALGHYTLLRLWKEILLIPLGLAAGYMLTKQRDVRSRVLSSKLTWLIAAFIGVQLIWGIAAYATHQVSIKALGYGLISDSRYLMFFLIVWVIALTSPKLVRSWPKLVLYPAVVVIVFGLLQYFVLPYNFLEHLGYSAKTIFPYEDINSNIHYIRIISSLRGADPLGAYLVVVITLAAALWYKHKSWWLVLLGAGGLLALILTFSRAAWIGFVLSVALLLWMSLKSMRARKMALLGTAVCLVIALVATITLRHNTTFQNIFLHTQSHSAVSTNSNQGHASALSSGLHDVLHNPLGNGPGTAGPASVYNIRAPARIAENYFIQIGQETGWIGFALFVAINAYVGFILCCRRTYSLALGLLAALVGLTFVNLLSHAWADDTLAYLWWGLAALAYSLPRQLTARPKLN